MSFSIIVPNYKNEVYLKKCLDSVLAQTYTDFECIVVNDCSPGFDLNQLAESELDADMQDFLDFMPAKLKPEEQAKFVFDSATNGDSRFQFITTPNNMGQGMAQNLALAKTTKDRLVILDADDFLSPDFLQKADEAIKQNPNKIYFSSAKIYKNGQISGYHSLIKYFPKINNLKSLLVFPNYSMTPFNYFWDLNLIKKANIKFRYPRRGQDTCFVLENLLELAKSNPNLAKSNFMELDAHYFYRVHPNQTTKTVSENMVFEHINDFLSQRLDQFQMLGFKYILLARLMILRFNLYQIRNNSGAIKTFFLNLVLKPLAVVAKVVSLI